MKVNRERFLIAALALSAAASSCKIGGGDDATPATPEPATGVAPAAGDQAGAASPGSRAEQERSTGDFVAPSGARGDVPSGTPTPVTVQQGTTTNSKGLVAGSASDTTGGKTLSATAGKTTTSPTKEAAVTSPTKEAAVTSPTKEAAVTSPTKEAAVTSPTKEAAVTSPTKEAGITSPTKEAIATPTKEK